MGYLVLKGLSRKIGWSFKEERAFRAFVAKGKIDHAVVHLVLPTTYMNESGIAVRHYLNYYKVPAENLIVVVDDIALPFGEMRIREKGSAGGHNGLKSIETHMGTQQFVRLRMGIGDHRQVDEPSQSSMGLADYVLGDFTSHELSKLEEFIDRGMQVLVRMINEPIARVMNAINVVIKKEVNPQTMGQQENKHDPN